MNDQPRYSKNFEDSQILAETTPAGTGWTRDFTKSAIANSDYTPAEELAIAEVQAYKEHAKRAAQNGWNLVCHPPRHGTGQRWSADLSPEQPVLVGEALCYATGWEEDGLYEVFLHSPYGPRVHVKKVRALTKDNYRHIHARVLAEKLTEEVGRIKKDAAPSLQRQFYQEVQDAAEDIARDLTRH